MLYLVVLEGLMVLPGVIGPVVVGRIHILMGPMGIQATERYAKAIITHRANKTTPFWYNSDHGQQASKQQPTKSKGKYDVHPQR